MVVLFFPDPSINTNIRMCGGALAEVMPGGGGGASITLEYSSDELNLPFLLFDHLIIVKTRDIRLLRVS